MNIDRQQDVETKIYAKPISYRLVEFLGEGLNSCVYRAIKENTEFCMSQTVAVKILKSEKLVSTWRSEIDRISAVRSKFCVGYLGWDIICGKPALVLEYVMGLTLEELIQGQCLSEQELCEVLGQGYRGLKDLQATGLFHGDINLQNIMVDYSGTVKLVDFGVYDAEGGLFTTPKYADPRVLAGQVPNIDTDIYSLRSVGFELAKKSKLNITVNIEQIELCVSAQARLAQKVNLLLANKERRQGLTQKILQLKKIDWNFKRFSQVIAMCAFLCVPLLSRGDLAVRHQEAMASVSVRGKNWRLIKINGQDRGYSPLDVMVGSSKAVLIEWSAATGPGQTLLTLKSGEHIVLDDEFFLSHLTRSE